MNNESILSPDITQHVSRTLFTALAVSSVLFDLGVDGAKYAPASGRTLFNVWQNYWNEWSGFTSGTGFTPLGIST